MFNENCWRQPVPTDILSSESFDNFDIAVFTHIMIHLRRGDTLCPPFYHGNRKFEDVALKRGQMIFKVSHFAKDLKVDRKRVKKSIEKLSKWYSGMDIEKKPYGLIVTCLEVDQIFKMDSEMHNESTMRAQREHSERTASKKTVKTVKTVETVKNKPQQKIFPQDSHAFLLSDILHTWIETNFGRRKTPPSLQTWAKDMDKLMRIDKQDFQKVKVVIQWTQTHHFWKGVILSPANLRKHWDTIIPQMQMDFLKRKEEQADRDKYSLDLTQN